VELVHMAQLRTVRRIILKWILFRVLCSGWLYY